MNAGNLIRAAARVLFYTVCTCVLIGAIFLSRLLEWFQENFTIGIREILYTILSPVTGAETKFLKVAFASCDIESLAVIAGLIASCAILWELSCRRTTMRLTVRTGRRTITCPLYPLVARLCLLCPLAVALGTIRSIASALQVSDYIASHRSETSIYEERYVTPKALGGTGRNLIYIYMESMETTYASLADGGRQAQENYMPHLTQLARENLNFSPTDGMGGFHSPSGTGWTMGALFATGTGVPFSFPVEGNSMGSIFEDFAPGITALGDMLEQAGYVQEFLCGSDADFAGRRNFFVQHGHYEIFDLAVARQKGYIPEDYHVWWGFEDEVLYRIAQDELLRLAALGKPFNLTMLTVDTHHVGGYLCRLCGNEYPEQLANVVACADRQVHDFVQWCQTQDFYRNTVIVIVGDHPRMDSYLVNGVAYYDRTIYNCFINSAKQPERSEKRREFTTLDLFPTVLSALGFTLDEHRLGLGTDLFSSAQTLAEEMGFEALNTELAKHSSYYMKNIAGIGGM